MGNVNHGHAKALLQLAYFAAHLKAQLGIKVRERFVHQAHCGLGHQCAAKGHALLLTAGKGRGLSVKQARKAQNFNGIVEAALLVSLGHLANLEAKKDILAHGKVRKQRVRLKHHGKAALCRGQVGYIAVANKDVAARDTFKPCDEPKCCGFAAAGRSQQDKQRTFINLKGHILHSVGRSPLFTYVFKTYCGQFRLLM